MGSNVDLLTKVDTTAPGALYRDIWVEKLFKNHYYPLGNNIPGTL